MKVRVPPVVASACMEFAKKVCKSYQDGKKDVSKGLAVEGKPRIDNDVNVQYVGRLAEVGVCLAANIPINALNWGDRCDSGHDLKLPDGRTVDVKASFHPAARMLIWPVSKVKFLNKAADVLVFCRVNTNMCDVEIVGWIDKPSFVGEATIAKGIPRVIDGTMFMDQDKLYKWGEIHRCQDQ